MNLKQAQKALAGTLYQLAAKKAAVSSTATKEQALEIQSLEQKAAKYRDNVQAETYKRARD